VSSIYVYFFANTGFMLDEKLCLIATSKEVCRKFFLTFVTNFET